MALRVEAMIARGYRVPIDIQRTALQVLTSGGANPTQQNALRVFLSQHGAKNVGGRVAKAIGKITGLQYMAQELWQNLDMLSIARASGQSTTGIQARLLLTVNQMVQRAVAGQTARNLAGKIAETIGSNPGTARMFMRSFASALKFGGVVAAAGMAAWQGAEAVISGAASARQAMGEAAATVLAYRGDIRRAEQIRREAVRSARAAAPISSFWAGAARGIGAEMFADYLERDIQKSAGERTKAALKWREEGREQLALLGIDPESALLRHAQRLRKNLADLTEVERGEALESIVEDMFGRTRKEAVRRIVAKRMREIADSPGRLPLPEQTVREQVLRSLDEDLVVAEMEKISAERVASVAAIERARRERLAQQRRLRPALELFAIRQGTAIIQAQEREWWRRHVAWRNDT
jgi:hypothetical protein